MIPSDPADKQFAEEVRSSLAGQLAQQLGFVKTQTELLTKLASTVPEFAKALDTLNELKKLKVAGAPDPSDAAKTAALAASVVATLRQETASPQAQLRDLFGALKRLGAGAIAPAAGQSRSESIGAGAGRVRSAAGRVGRKVGRGFSQLRAAAKAGGFRGGARLGASSFGAAGGGGAAAGLAGGVAGIVAVGAMKVFDAGVGVFQVLAGSLTRYLSPVAVVSAAINSQTSGYSAVGKAFSLLGSTLGLFLLPVFVAFGGAIAALAGYVGEKMLPALAEWTEAVTKGALKMAEFLQRVFGTSKKTAQEALSPAGAEPKPITAAAADESGGQGAGLTGTGSLADRLAGGIELITRELAMGAGGKAQSVGSGADFAKQLQMAALNQSPIEELQRQLLQSSLGELQRIATLLRDGLGPKPRQ